MNIKSYIIAIIALLAFEFANAQTQGERIPTTEVIRLVSDAFSKNNAIYTERIKGHEEEYAELKKAIYSANTELMAIRSLLAGNQMLKRGDYAKLERPLADLKTLIEAVQPPSSDVDLQQSIRNVGVKAKAVRKIIQKTKNKRY